MRLPKVDSLLKLDGGDDLSKGELHKESNVGNTWMFETILFGEWSFLKNLEDIFIKQTEAKLLVTF